MNANKAKIIFLLGTLFLYNTFKFLGKEGNKSPILETLFNMIIFVFIVVVILYKNN